MREAADGIRARLAFEIGKHCSRNDLRRSQPQIALEQRQNGVISRLRDRVIPIQRTSHEITDSRNYAWG